MNREGQNRVATLDGIRGIAIFLVLAGHIADNYQPISAETRRWLVAFANPGAGVRLFFVLSGYLITWLMLRERAATGRISVPQFYFRRALRILPAFYVFLGCLFVIDRIHALGLSPAAWLAAGTFTWNYALFWVPTQPGGWYVGHLWTLAVEQQFYLLWPLVLAFAGSRRARISAFVLAVWCPLARVATYYLFPDQRGAVGMMLHTGIDSLMIGCAAALLVNDPGKRDFLLRRGAAGAAVGAAWLLVASPLMTILVRGSGVAVGFTCDAVAAAWIIAWVHYRPAAGVEAFLGRGLLPKLGVISYSLYLWQQVFLAPDGPLARGHVLGPVCAAIAVATLSLWVVERPALGLSSRRTAKAAAPVAGEAVSR